MELNPTTPALLYPTVSLLLLAYTQRFLTLANLVRSLHADYHKNKDEWILKEIGSLRFRIHLIRNMQWLGVLSLLFCTVCLFFIYLDHLKAAEITFAIALLLLICSLGISVVEIQNSVHALDMHLRDVIKEAEEDRKHREKGR